MRRETRGGVENAFCSFVLDTYILRHVHDDMHDEKSRKRSEIGVLLRPRVLGALPVAAKVSEFFYGRSDLSPTGKLSRMNESLRGPSLEPRAPREAQQHARRVAPSPKNHTGACHRPDPARPSASRLAISQISNALFLLAPAPGAQISNARSSPAPRTELTPYALRVPARRLPRRVPRWTPPPPPPA